ncbi:MAG: hypothetical protein ACI9SG_000118 [Maribacter sp.]|jgi:hypothetical protein
MKHPISRLIHEENRNGYCFSIKEAKKIQLTSYIGEGYFVFQSSLQLLQYPILCIYYSLRIAHTNMA